jgi:hypothetical protein
VTTPNATTGELSTGLLSLSLFGFQSVRLRLLAGIASRTDDRSSSLSYGGDALFRGSPDAA